jgi:NAD(P)-dependent dehydrogenase (short-subunit alcohol dehydrogenase family)
MTDKICLITGVGPGTGTALVHRFAEGGYKVAMLARNQARLGV